MTATDRVLIFDTTLRDGEQSPGCSMTQPEKLRVARALAELSVDVIEAGFPAASRGDWEAVNAVAREIQGPIIAGLARCTREDIELAARALEPAPRHRLHVFLATSAIHRQYKLNMAQEEIIRRAVEGVRIAREYCDDVEFSPEDASRTELDFLAQVVEAVIEAGATTINIPDTVGYTVPDEFGELFRYLRKHVRGIDKVTLSVHCHDDLGMAVANSLTAVVAGARQIECTINGIGERAGNCSLEEVVMALATRAAFFNLRPASIPRGCIRPAAWCPASPACRSRATRRWSARMPLPMNPASTSTACCSTARPTRSCGPRTSACSAATSCSASTVAGMPFAIASSSSASSSTTRELNRVFEEFKALADRKKELFDGDIEALVLRAGGAGAGPWILEQLDVEAHSGSQARPRVRLKHADGRVRRARSHRRRPGRCRLQGDRAGDRRRRDGSQVRGARGDDRRGRAG